MLINFSALVIACFIILVYLVLFDLTINGHRSWLAGQYRYLLYTYWTKHKKYRWQVMHEFGGSYYTEPMNRTQALRFLSKSGEVIKGIDENLKVIFCRAK
jgi:hypothetical protein